MSEDILRGPHAQITVGECEECKRLRVELDATEDAARMYAERSSRFAGQADKWESAAVSGLQAVEYWQAEANQARAKCDETEACLAFERVTVAELRAEVERLRKDPLPALAMLRDIERTVAERQREACSDEVYSCKNAQWLAEVAKAVRATPLVTEGES